jgi:hypothetical protein
MPRKIVFVRLDSSENRFICPLNDQSTLLLPGEADIVEIVEEFLRLKQCGPYRLAETTPFGVINNKHMLDRGDEGDRDHVRSGLTFVGSKTIE